MTLATEDRFARLARRGPSGPSARRTMVADLTQLFADLLEESRILRWPSEKYANDPVAYCEEILGFEPWSRQIEIIEAVRDNPRTAVASAQKCGKTKIAAAAGLWFYSTVPGGRVFLAAPRAGQVQNILWPEISQMHKRSGRCLDCRLREPEGPRPCEHGTELDGELSPRSTTGLRGTDDGRVMMAITSKTIESLAGYSGPQLWIIDEASGVDDSVFDVIDGNALGGGLKILAIGNPTRNKGRLFEAFNSAKRSKAYARVQMSAEEAASARDRQGQPFGHLAKAAEIEERKELWGEDSSLYIVRVKGEYALNEEGAIFSVNAIAEAIARWHQEEFGEGRLFIGCDPAGATGLGDETAFAIRRGTKVLPIETHRGMNEDAHLAEMLRLVELHKRDRETPVVVVDREGSIGSVLHSRIIEYLDRFRAPRRAPFEYVPVRASAPAERMPQAYPRVRDELIANLERWMRTGSIPDDDMLSKELNTVQWIEQIDQRLKATPKEELRRILERSPDRMDAIALACWESISLRMQDSGALPPSAQDAIGRDRRALDSARAPAGGWEGFGADDGSNGNGRRRDPHRALAEQRGRRVR